MDAKLPMDTFEDVMGLSIEGCKAIATYIREVHNFLLIFHYARLQFIQLVFCLH
jgi:exosome complex component RRP41